MNMKISLYLPENASDPAKFLSSEIAEARNIKNKTNRKATIRGLQKIAVACRERYESVAYFTDGNELLVEDYNGKKRKYHCGRDYLRIEEAPYEPYLLVVVDSKEASIGLTDGEHIRCLWYDESFVMHKHGKGGQSQRRFERGREQALKQWFRKVVDKIRDFDDGERRLIIGSCGLTTNQFYNELPT